MSSLAIQVIGVFFGHAVVETDGAVIGDGVVDPDATIILVILDHGVAEEDPDDLETQLATPGAGCEGNCPLVQHSVHNES